MICYDSCCRLFVQGGDVKACIDNCGFGGGGGHKGVAIVRRYKGGPGIEVFAVGELRFEGLSNSMQYFNRVVDVDVVEVGKF